MKKSIALFLILLGLFTVLASQQVQARGRYGSHRVGGYNSHGKGSHYTGGHVRSCHGRACR